MSFATQSLIAQDADFISRCNSCAAVEVPDTANPNPLNWVAENIWQLATSPGFDAAYESALASGIGRPGWEPTVIPDADILAAVQARLAEQGG
jgi:hypothetical protein